MFLNSQKSTEPIKLCECQKKKCIWNTKYTIQHRIERSQATKSIQYNIHDTKSYELPNCVNDKKCAYIFKKSFWFRTIKLCECQKKCIWNTKYTIQHRIKRSQSTKSIQYNIHDTKSCELLNCVNEKNVHMFLKSRFGSVLSNCLNARKKMHLEYEIHNTAWN